MAWTKLRAGLYEARDSDGLLHRVERTGSWWVRSCGLVRVRYETLAAAKQSVREAS